MKVVKENNPAFGELSLKTVRALRQARLDIAVNYRSFSMLSFHGSFDYPALVKDREALLDGRPCRIDHCIGGYMMMRLPEPNFRKVTVNQLEDYYQTNFDRLFYDCNWDQDLREGCEHHCMKTDAYSRKVMSGIAIAAIDRFIEYRGVEKQEEQNV